MTFTFRHGADRIRSLLVLFACCVLSGCTWFAPRDWIAQSARPAPRIEPGMIQIDAHLIQRPLGDAFLDQEVWKQTDSLTVPHATRELLDQNGIRVGQVVGLAPGKLQELARSPRWCLDPRRRVIPSGDSFRQVLSPVLRDCPIDLATMSKQETIHFDQAKFLLEVTAKQTKDQRTLLKFTPKVETGESYMPYSPSEDGGWKLSLERSTKSLTELSWEVTLEPGAVLLIGGHAAKQKTVGHRAFIQETDEGPVQRLLVLRTTRSSEADAPTFEDMARMPSPAELAVQVSVPAIRASGR